MTSLAEAKIQQSLKELRNMPDNKACANCNEHFPNYVNMTFSVFVCDSCSGVHREFGHRIKGISLSSFTTDEVKTLQQAGNAKFKEILLSRWDPSRLPKPEHGNAENTRRWIRAVYVDKAFEYRAPPTNKQPSSGQQQRTSAPKPTVDDLLGNWDTPAQPDPTHITGQVAQIPAPAPVFDMFGPNQGQHHQHQLQQQQQYVAPQYQQAPINLGQGQGQGYAMGSPPQQDYFNPFAPQMLAAQQQPPIPAAPVAGGAPKQQPNPMQPYPGQPLIIQQPPYNHQQPSQPVYVNPFGGQPMMIPQGQQMLINPHHQQQPGQPVRPMMVTNLPNGQQVMVLQQHPPMGTMIAQPQQPNGMYNNPFGGVAFPPQHPQQMPPQTGPVANPGGFFAVPQVGFGGQQPPLQQPQNLHPIGGIRPRTDWNQQAPQQFNNKPNDVDDDYLLALKLQEEENRAAGGQQQRASVAAAKPKQPQQYQAPPANYMSEDERLARQLQDEENAKAGGDAARRYF